MFGYNGKILRVNLTSGAITVDNLDEKFCRKYVGGAGFNTYFMMKELKPGIDPLGPENKMFFMMGPMTGLPVSGSGRNCVSAKSPLTNGYGKSEVGGFFGAEVRHAGFDGIIVEGRATRPSYIWVHDGQAEIRDAAKYWGKDTKETQEGIRAELNDKRIRLAMIGPAGENMVRFACVINDLTEAAGRGGMGAIMGSKNLKAIAARGTGMPQMADPDALGEFRQWLMDNRKLWEANATFGTGAPAMMQSMLPMGNMPIENFRKGDFPVTKIDGGTLKNTIGVGMEGCFGCVVRCKKLVKVDDPGLKVDPEYGGPEYEALASMGSNCGVDDLKYVSKGNEICNATAMDAIAAGDTVAFAMECYEKGLITNKDTGGLDLSFGNKQAMVKLLDMIAHRQGIGDLFAEGPKYAAKKIGKGAEELAMQVKGVDVPMHDPRAKAGLGIGYVVNPHGADHCANIHDTAYVMPNPALEILNPLGITEPVPADDLSAKKVYLFKMVQQYRVLSDHLVMCYFVPFTPVQFAQMLSASTGWNTGIMELMRVVERTLTLARMYNLREGLSVADDKLPKRFFTPHTNGLPASKPAYSEEKLERAKAYYYSLMGWDKNGVPTPETLDAYGLEWAAGK